MGLLLIVSLGAIAFVVSDPLHQLLYNEFFLQQGYEDFADENFKYLVAVITFVLLLTLASLLYAAFQPSKANRVTERDLKKERDRRRKEQEEQKRRKQMINKKVAAERREREEASQMATSSSSDKRTKRR